MPEIGERPDTNFNAVVFATDLSDWSQNAGLYAAAFAEHLSAKLLVAHAFILAQAAMEVEIARSEASQQRKNLQLLLSESASGLARGSIKPVPILIEGDPKIVIPELADQNAPSLIVLGTHGAGRLERALIGSVAEGILRSTSQPSCTVGPHVPRATAGSFPFRRILCATDFTAAAVRAVMYAVSFAEKWKCDIDVLNVISSDDVHHPERLGDLDSEFYRALDNLVPERAKEFCHPRTFVETGKAYDQILQHIREREIDLLVLGIRPASHLGFEVRTSGAFRLMVDVPCPVLTVTG